MHDALYSALQFCRCLAISLFQVLWFKRTAAMKCTLVCNQQDYRRAQEQCNNHTKKKWAECTLQIWRMTRTSSFLHLWKATFYLEIRFHWEKNFLTMPVISHISFPYVDENAHREYIFNREKVSH